MTYGEELGAISQSLVRGEVGFLIGAGMSIESGAPDGAELSRRMLRRAILGPKYEMKKNDELDATAEGVPFEAIAALLRPKLGYDRDEFPEWLASEEGGGLGSLQPNRAHLKLAELRTLIGRRFPSLLFTTNFDHLIERAFGEGDEALSVTSDTLGNLRKAKKEGKISVVHLHGALDAPKSILIGEEALATMTGSILDLLRGALATDIFVIVGYSLADTNIRAQFFDIQRIARTRSGIKKRTFAVSPAQGDPADKKSEASVLREIWKERGVDHIALEAGTFFEQLFEATDNFVLVDMKEKVARALGKDLETLEEMLRTAAKPFAVLEPEDILFYLYYALTPYAEEHP